MSTFGHVETATLQKPMPPPHERPVERQGITFGEADEAAVRARLRAELPADTFAPTPARYLWFVVLQAVIWGGIAAVLVGGLPWYVNLALAIVVGHTLGAQGFLAHEALHGALGGPEWLRRLVGWLGFGPYLVSPELWVRWHNMAHHGHTNDGDRDPDNFGTTRRYEKHPGQARFITLAPGSGRWFSYFFLSYSYVFHSQMVLWLQTKHRKEFEGFNRPRAIAQSMSCLVAWGALAVFSGSLAVYTVVVPLLVANTVVQSYILTNHFLRPMAKTNNPLDNSMSIATFGWLDRLHFRFSHHVEHHLFPGMPGSKAPRVRAWLERHYPERFVCMPHWQAIKLLYSTPRVFADAVTLVDVGPPHRKVDVRSLTGQEPKVARGAA